MAKLAHRHEPPGGARRLKKTIGLAAGDTGTAPAGMRHYSAAKGPTTIAVTCDFPYTITYLRRFDVPRGGFPHGN